MHVSVKICIQVSMCQFRKKKLEIYVWVIFKCGREKFASKILSAFINDLTLPSPGVLKGKFEFTHPKIESIGLNQEESIYYTV